VYALSLNLDRGQETANANRIIAFTVLTSRKKEGVLSAKIGCLSGKLMFARNKTARSPRYRNSHTSMRLPVVRREITYLVLEPDNIRDATDALRYSNEIPPGPLPYQISRSPIAIRTCWEQWKKVPLVLNQRSGKGHAQWTVFIRIFQTCDTNQC
jgi:hypothetical protein